VSRIVAANDSVALCTSRPATVMSSTGCYNDSRKQNRHGNVVSIYTPCPKKN